MHGRRCHSGSRLCSPEAASVALLACVAAVALRALRAVFGAQRGFCGGLTRRFTVRCELHCVSALGGRPV